MDSLKALIILLAASALSPGAVRAQPVFQKPTVSNNIITLSWSAVPGRLYQLQYTTNLNSISNGWTDVGSFIVAATNAVTVQDDIRPLVPFHFHRVLLLPTNYVGNFSAITSATGGSYAYTNGNFITRVFLSTANFTVVSGSGPVESLVIGGGGAYGGEAPYYSGAGGAGGLIHTSLSTLPVYGPGTYPVVVGAGGTGYNPSTATGNNGGNSSFNAPNGIIAYGGGGGAGWPGGYQAPGGPAATGGSGGGGNSFTVPGAASISGLAYGSAVSEGNSGGGGSTYSGGGGGGAGHSGLDASGNTGGAGGDGLFFELTGNALFDTWYAGGGAGGGNGDPAPPATPGLGYNSYGGTERNGIVILRYRYQ